MQQYTVTGMSCAACSARVEKAVLSVQGVTSCSVNLLTHSMGVEGTVKDEEIVAAVTAAGYGAFPKQQTKKSMEEEALKDKETPILRKRLLASLGFWLVLMYVSMGHGMWGWPLPSFFSNNPVAIGLLQLLLTVVVMIINQKFFVSGFLSLWRKSPNMDALVSLGSSAAFAYSTVALFAMTDAQSRGDATVVTAYMHELYFESAATILTLITLGKLLEARAKGKTTDALRSLTKLTPQKAVLLLDEQEITIPLEFVKKGDIFVVRPGEQIPVDGVVLDGNSVVNESVLTGESIPVDKNKGSTVSAGTLNQSGFIRCEATRVGEDTTLSQIIQMVSDAAATKAPVAKIADRVSGVFVPIVMALSLLTIALWLLSGQTVGFALARGISVLVISCPCALGLATPVAIMVGNGVGAKHGILFKTAVSLEQTGKTQMVVLDKTGTITKGQPEVTDVLPAGTKTKEELLSLAFALEQKSEHPLAKAIVSKAKQEGVVLQEVLNFVALPGHGLSACLDKTSVFGGNYEFIKTKIPISAQTKAQAERFAKQGKTALFFASEEELFGIIAVADRIREESPQAIWELKNMGIHVVMLTGDHAHTAKAIGAQAGVDEVIAGVLPDGKERVIQELKKKGKVIMVGDGINDAPALTSADIGMAIGAGTDVAIDAADVVLVKSRLSDVPAAIRLSRATLRNIHENLFWAFFYNMIGIPLAAGLWIPILGWKLDPMFAATAMSLSSFCVVTNALRLNLLQIYDTKRDKKYKQRIKKQEGEIQPMQKTLTIEGMMCGHCEMHAKKALEALDGVQEAQVSHESGTAVVLLEKEVADEVLKQAIADEGYTVTEIA